MTEKAYKSIETYFKKHILLYKLLKLIYSYLPKVVIVSYVFSVGYMLTLLNKRSIEVYLKFIGVPALVFVVITVFRKVFNSQRPYEKFNITPLVFKDKKGHSFPSRHAASAFVIGMAFLFINNMAGIIFLGIASVISLTRVLAGVHFIKDVLWGSIFSIVCGWIFMFII